MKSKGAKIEAIHDLSYSLKLLKGGPDGVEEWNYRRLIGEVPSNLSRVNLRGAFLCGADLSGVNLSGADIREASLRFGDFRGTSLYDTNLCGADFYGANLHRADLRRARLDGANLVECRCRNTIFADIDLSDVRGLESIEHNGPSTIGLDTFIKSHGRICQTFLRGCGVPDTMTEKMFSLIVAMKPDQFLSCFISYSTKDEEFAKRLQSRMVQEKLRVWFAPKDMQGGKKLHEQIDEAIRGHDKLLLVLSPESMNSEWVMTEIRKARKAELKENRRKLFPIRLVDFATIRDWECFDADSGKDLGVEIREYFIPDFSNWKDHDAFETAFARLLEDLKRDDVNSITTVLPNVAHLPESSIRVGQNP
jgi:hypothetical protein